MTKNHGGTMLSVRPCVSAAATAAWRFCAAQFEIKGSRGGGWETGWYCQPPNIPRCSFYNSSTLTRLASCRWKRLIAFEKENIEWYRNLDTTTYTVHTQRYPFTLSCLVYLYVLIALDAFLSPHDTLQSVDIYLVVSHRFSGLASWGVRRVSTPEEFWLEMIDYIMMVAAILRKVWCFARWARRGPSWEYSERRRTSQQNHNSNQRCWTDLHGELLATIIVCQ